MRTKFNSDSLTPVITVKDVMEKFKVCRGTALKIMKQPELHAYYLGKSLYVEKTYWDEYIENALNIGGTTKLVS